MNGLRAITVCVDYTDLLALTLPYNRHHFSEMMVVTSWRDTKTRQFCLDNGIALHETDLFYMNGAKFNKWAALEEGLDQFGRTGWFCLLDADVLWPKTISFPSLQSGKLYTPRRRMYPSVPLTVPPESEWGKYPIHRNEGEFAGYSQIFHTSDPALGPGPWHETDWKHGGGADSFFQQRWKHENKVRPPFEVLHLGEPGVNWMGRVTAYADGSLPEGAITGRREMNEMWTKRRRNPRTNPFDGEKIV